MLQTAIFLMKGGVWFWFNGHAVLGLDGAHVEVLRMVDEGFRRGATTAVGYAFDAATGRVVHQRTAAYVPMPVEPSGAVGDGPA